MSRAYWRYFYSSDGWDIWTHDTRKDIRDIKLFRVLALCLMSAIAEDEERTKKRTGAKP